MDGCVNLCTESVAGSRDAGGHKMRRSLPGRYCQLKRRGGKRQEVTSPAEGLRAPCYEVRACCLERRSVGAEEPLKVTRGRRRGGGLWRCVGSNQATDVETGAGRSERASVNLAQYSNTLKNSKSAAISRFQNTTLPFPNRTPPSHLRHMRMGLPGSRRAGRRSHGGCVYRRKLRSVRRQLVRRLLQGMKWASTSASLRHVGPPS